MYSLSNWESRASLKGPSCVFCILIRITVVPGTVTITGVGLVVRHLCVCVCVNEVHKYYTISCHFKPAQKNQKPPAPGSSIFHEALLLIRRSNGKVSALKPSSGSCSPTHLSHAEVQSPHIQPSGMTMSRQSHLESAWLLPRSYRAKQRDFRPLKPQKEDLSLGKVVQPHTFMNIKRHRGGIIYKPLNPTGWNLWG